MAEEKSVEATPKASPPPPDPAGVALDVGTMFCVSARQKGSGVELKKLRNVFLELDKDAQRLLKLSKVNFIQKDDSVILLGDDALSVANLFNKEVRRPLNKGVISPTELDAVDVLSTIFSQLVGKPKVDKEVCYYSVPANPLDADYNVIYHQAVIGRILTDILKFNAKPMNEATAVVYSNCQTEGFSGIGISFGAGMTNVALCWKTISPIQFSVARGGDWIDHNSAKATGGTASKLASIKEKGLNLLDYQSGNPLEVRFREALMVHYKSLILYVLDNFVEEFKKCQQTITLPEPIPIVISGGTSLAGGFVELFKEALAGFKGFPVEVSEVRHATNPLCSVAEGLLVAALSEG